MKQGIGIFALSGALAFLLAASCERPHEPAGSVSVSSPQEQAFGVEELLEHPRRQERSLVVTGIVGAVAPAEKLFSLVDLSDRKEIEETGKTTCATLPVQWSGTLPLPRDAVRVRGQVVESAGKLVFSAEAVEKHALPEDRGQVR